MKKHRTVHKYKMRKKKIKPKQSTTFILKKSSSKRLMDSFLNDTDKYFRVFNAFAELNAFHHEMYARKFYDAKNYFQSKIRVKIDIYEEITDETISKSYKFSVESLNETNFYYELDENTSEPLHEYSHYLEPKNVCQLDQVRSDTLINSLSQKKTKMSHSETF